MKSLRWWAFFGVVSIGLGREVRVVGSDLLGADFTAAIERFAVENDQSVQVDFEGSHPGWLEMQAGRAHVGLFSFPPSSPLPSAEYFSDPLAYHIAAVAVASSLSLRQISLPQLAGVFGSDEGAGGKRWSEMGETGPVASKRVAPRILGQRQSFLWVFT